MELLAFGKVYEKQTILQADSFTKKVLQMKHRVTSTGIQAERLSTQNLEDLAEVYHVMLPFVKKLETSVYC